MKTTCKWKKVVFFFLMCLLIPFICEGILWALSGMVPEVLSLNPLEKERPKAVSGERFEFRPDPEFKEHDSNGFRNQYVPKTVDVVAIGDSQTYGAAGVKRKKAWPQQLESMSGKSVYNMAFGGWGPVEYSMLLKEASSLQPKIVIAAVYSGNDLINSYDLVYNHGQKQNRKSEARSIQKSIRQAENDEPILDTIKRKTRRIGWGWDKPEGLRRFLHQYSKLYALWRKFRALMAKWKAKNNSQERDKARGDKTKRQESSQQKKSKWKRKKALADRYKDVVPFKYTSYKTLFTPYYRLTALDQSDPRVQEGVRIAFRSLRKMQQRCKKRDVHFSVLLIPTKEYVWNHLVRRKKENDDESFDTGYRQLIEHEKNFWRKTEQFLETHNVDYIHALPFLRNAFREGGQPYQIGKDGHPNAQGHRALAEAAKKLMNRFGKRSTQKD